MDSNCRECDRNRSESAAMAWACLTVLVVLFGIPALAIVALLVR